jgi:hypothetical protein
VQNRECAEVDEHWWDHSRFYGVQVSERVTLSGEQRTESKALKLGERAQERNAARRTLRANDDAHGLMTELAHERYQLSRQAGVAVVHTKVL